MNFKQYHVSKNLLSEKYENRSINGSGAFTIDSNYDLWLGEVVAGQTYTISNMDYVYGFFATKPMPNTGTTYDGSRGYEMFGTAVVTVPSGCTWVAVRVLHNANNAMLNTGSTALPYEPYSSEVWHDTPHYIHNTSTDTLTTLPAVIYPTGTTATVGLKGQTTQSSIPSPTSPVMPQGTGERTGNLAQWEKGGISTTTGKNEAYRTKEQGGTCEQLRTQYISCIGDSDYVLSVNKYPVQSFISFYDENKNYLTRTSGSPQGGTRTFKANINAKYMRAQISHVTQDQVYPAIEENAQFAITLGSTALPYEPYGYKIPISSASTTTPVYLGEVETTRKIKKLVLTGEENIIKAASNPVFTIQLVGSNTPLSENAVTTLSTHYQAQNNATGTGNVGDMKVCVRRGYGTMYIGDTRYDNATDFKAYLAQQYANGTPVTVWYVLANPETAVVNEPLMKIGEYADEVSGISIPTTAGANTLSVDTTLQPSEVTATYKGWHPVQSVHVYPDSSWMPTSWEEFRKAVRSGKAQSLYPVGTKLYENWGDTTSNAWIVVDYPTGEDYLDSDLAQQGYTNRVMLMEEKLNYLRQFDAIEAWLYVETTIPAGTYRFTIPNYDASYGGNKTYIFTSTANVPVGGQLTLTWNYQQNPSAVQAYSSATSTSALFNVSITEWDGTTVCTDLGTIKLAQNDADSTYGKLNHIHRVRYGSNNYYQSGYRQWLNADATANNWWTPSNIFDRPYDNRNTAGRLNALNSNMKAVLATPTVNCITNNQFEYPSLDGTTFSLQTAYTVKDKLFPVTHSEINLSSSPNVNSVLDYYVGKGNADRIKYRKDNGDAYYWWLRTPYPTVAYYVRGVHTSGALYYYYALNPCGSAAACIIQ